MTKGSETEPREFLRRLRDETVIAPVRILGMVKAQDSKSDYILFSQACADWIPIPIDLIESLDHLGSAPCKDHSHPLVAISLKEPESAEGRVFAQLLNSYRPPQKLREETLCSICLASCRGLPPELVFDCIGNCAKDCPNYGGVILG